tara:strand:- start:171 stop:461 length:291 start_codon:yes stop_codon:yes gene_type:complete
VTTIVNCNETDRYDVYIGRPSKWGNPFVIGTDGTRAEVISKYKEWILSNDSLLHDLKELDGKVLGCWCKPKSCHGDILIELLQQQKKTDIIDELFN